MKKHHTIGIILGVIALSIIGFFVESRLPSISRALGYQVVSLEAETAALTSNITVGSDTTASNQQFIQFGSAPVASPTSLPSPTNSPADLSFQPTAPYYATYFYLWSLNPNTDSSWSYWTDGGKNPPNTWFSNYIPDPKPTVFDPAYELYSNNNYEIFKWQVAKLAEAKQEVAIGSWFGRGTKQDTALKNILNDFMKRGDNPYPNLRWAIYYEDEGFNDPSVSAIVTDLQHFEANFTSSPYFLKVDGKPVVFVYGNASDEPGTLLTRWRDANAQMGNRFYIVLKLFSGFASASPQPNSWHQYAPAVRSGTHAPYSSFVSPGFWLDGSAERLPRNAAEFETAVKGMVGSNATWKQVQTWNEWGEGTSVEPGERVRTNTTTGKDEIDPTAPPFKNLYIDILNRNLPPLERGTGAGGVSIVPTSPPDTPTATTVISNPTATRVATATPSNPTVTSVSSGSDPVVVAVGDIACGVGSTGAACKQMQTSDTALAANPNAAVVLGDIQYEEGSLTDFQNYYDPSWGRLKNITYPVVGNHEYLTTNAQGYFDYFNGVGNQTGRAGDRSKGYYAVDIGAWRLYVLNSNCSKAGGCGVGSPQEQWLRADLAANPRTCVLAAYHHPMRTSGSRSTTTVAPLFQALYDYNAEIILAGHEHNYERFAPQDVNGNLDNAKGIREFVVGAGGRNFTQFVTTAPNSLVKNADAYGVLKLTLHPSSFDFKYLPIAGSSFTDSGTSVGCH